jgi:acetate kinase
MQAILTLNAGSSSLKFALYGQESLQTIAIGQIDGIGSDPSLVIRDGAGKTIEKDALEGSAEIKSQASALALALDRLARHGHGAQICAVGHRIVHGGIHFREPVILTDAIEQELQALCSLAPLHQPHNLAGVAAARVAFPDAPQIACFDTAFHRGQSFVSEAFAIPRAFYDEGVRRYGFHGLSYEYVSGHLAEIAPYHARSRVIICHLGSGASMCALKDGRSVSSTMGFSALDGLPMGTRPGQIDPGVLLYLMEEKGLPAKKISTLLYKESGLLGLSNLSNDMRVLSATDDLKARQAIEYFVHRCRHAIGALVADLQGLDAIVFTAGIGENSAPVREQILQGLGWLGVEVDPARNNAGEQVISRDGSRIAAYIIRTDEERMIATHVRRLVPATAAELIGA